MIQRKMEIQSIPCILWGKPSEKIYIHVHGKMSRKEHAEAFAQIAEENGYQTLSFDLPEHGERRDSTRCDVWNGTRDLQVIWDYAFANWQEVSLFACSLGAWFSLQAYAEVPLAKCLFQSPIVDMKYLVRQMMSWFDVSEELLKAKGEIDTPVDPLRWDYYQYILRHPVERWSIPTRILYGARDDMQAREVMEAFSEKFHCRLTVAKNCEHAFMQPGDDRVIEGWLRENI